MHYRINPAWSRRKGITTITQNDSQDDEESQEDPEDNEGSRDYAEDDENPEYLKFNKKTDTAPYYKRRYKRKLTKLPTIKNRLSQGKLKSINQDWMMWESLC